LDHLYQTQVAGSAERHCSAAVWRHQSPWQQWRHWWCSQVGIR